MASSTLASYILTKGNDALAHASLHMYNQQELRSWFEANDQFPSTTPAAHLTNSAGLLFQYLRLSSTYSYAVAWHRDRVYFQSYFELSFSSKYKVAIVNEVEI